MLPVGEGGSSGNLTVPTKVFTRSIQSDRRSPASICARRSSIVLGRTRCFTAWALNRLVVRSLPLPFTDVAGPRPAAHRPGIGVAGKTGTRKNRKERNLLRGVVKSPPYTGGEGMIPHLAEAVTLFVHSRVSAACRCRRYVDPVASPRPCRCATVPRTLGLPKGE